MKRLHWYVIKSFLGPFIMTFFIVVFVLLMQFLWKYVDDLVGKGLEVKVLAEMLFYAAFGLLPYAFPLAMLLASIMTFGDLGENYELVAMKSSGISLFRIMRPLIFIAVIITGLAFYFGNYVLPVTNLKFYNLLASVKQQRPELVLQKGIFTNEIDGYSIKVGDKDSKSHMLYDLLVYDHSSRNRSSVNENVTVADSGFLEITEDKRYMILTMYDGVNYTEEPPKNRRDLNNRPFRRDRFKEQIVRVKVNNFEFTRGDENRYRSADKMLSIRQLKAQEDTLGQTYFRQVRAYLAQISINPILSNKVFNLTTDVDSIKRKIESVPDTLINFDSYFNSLDKWKKAEIALMAKDRATNNYRNLNIYKDQLYERKKFINKYAMEVHRKFTLSIAVLVFFFIGAPLGAIIRKGGLGMPVVVSIFLFVLYYIVSMTGEKSAREEVWQMFSGMWFSTFVFLPIGIWLSYKAATDSAIMSSETYSKIFSRFSSLKNIIFRKKGKTERNVA